MEAQELVNFAKECQGTLELNTSSLIRIGGQVAAKVNTIKGLSGPEKQQLVCQVLKTLISEKVADAEQAASLKKTVDEVLPASLDLALAAARGKLDLKKVKMSVWVKYFSCCFRSVVSVLASKHVISQEQAKQAESALNSVESSAVVKKVIEDSSNDIAVSEKEKEKEEEKEEKKFEHVNPMVSVPVPAPVAVEKSEDTTQESKAVEAPKSE